MKSVGLCHICGKPALSSCPLCGRLVCESHMDQSSGVCMVCKGEKPNGIGKLF